MSVEITFHKPTFGYLSDLGERVGDHALTEIRRLQIAKTKQRDGSGPGARGHLGGPRHCLRVDILPDVRQFAIPNGNVKNSVVLERPVGGFDSPSSEADDQNPVSLRYEFGGHWVCRFYLFGRLLKHSRQFRVPAVRAGQRPALARNDPLNICGN